MQILISRTGLVLNPGQMADLVLAWRQVAGLIAGIPAKRALIDDAAFSFRLSPPSKATVAANMERSAEPAGNPAAGRPVKAAVNPGKLAMPKRPAAAAAKRPAKSPKKAARSRSGAEANLKTKAATRNRTLYRQ